MNINTTASYYRVPCLDSECILFCLQCLVVGLSSEHVLSGCTVLDGPLSSVPTLPLCPVCGLCIVQYGHTTCVHYTDIKRALYGSPAWSYIPVQTLHFSSLLHFYWTPDSPAPRLCVLYVWNGTTLRYKL